MKFKINIPSNANKIIHKLQFNGFSAYVVGGCVRDSILKKIPHDWDICTSAKPKEIINMFSDFKIIETGLKHGTVTIVIDDEVYEVTTYRIDGKYSDNRRPDSVSFTDNIIEDLKRRDFTINAIAYNDEVGIVDPFNGMQDIYQQRISCVGFAEDRFSEDALRILRAIRFSSQLNFTLTPDTDWEIHRLYKNLKNISIERINSEFCKIVASDNFCIQMILYKDVFSLFIPEIKDMFDFQQNNPYHLYDVWGHTVHAVENCEEEDLIVKLAVFFHDIGKPHSFQNGEDGIRHFKGHGKVSADITDKIMKYMKFDNNTRNSVVQLVYYHDATIELGEKYIKRWLNKIGEDQFRRLLLVRRADINGQNPEYKDCRIDKIDKIEDLLESVLAAQQCFSLKDLAINGNDIIEHYCVNEGKVIGKILNDVLDKVIDGKLKNEKEKLIEYIEKNESEVVNEK